ncbi:hypothetical protein [Nocardia sp. NPDC004722]
MLDPVPNPAYNRSAALDVADRDRAVLISVKKAIALTALVAGVHVLVVRR